MEEKIMGWLEKIQIKHILIVIILIFIPILKNDFVGDDFDFIFHWEEIRSTNNISELLKGSLPSEHVGVYRPLRSLLYLITYNLFGESAIFYHAYSILIHLIATLYVYKISKFLTNENSAKITSLIFGIIPVHTEAVSFITPSIDTFGIVLALLGFYKYITNKKTLSYTLAFAAAFFYEITLVLPAIAVFYELIVNKNTIKKSITQSKYLWNGALLYILLRIFIINVPSRSTFLGGKLLNNIIISFQSIVIYFFISVWPHKPTFIHYFGKISSYTTPEINQEILEQTSMVNSGFILSLIIIITSLLFVIKTKNKHIKFGAAWFILSIFPVLNIFPIGSLFSERYVYLASFGSALIASQLFMKISKTKYKLSLLPALILFVVFSSKHTLYRNSSYNNEISLWGSESKMHPQDVVAKYKLGRSYYEKQEYDLAEKAYKEALGLKPNFKRALYHMSLLKTEQKKYQEAEDYVNKTIFQDPQYQPAIDLKSKIMWLNKSI
ncbi:tetratricopeptide repeat protein [Patescibacteria group bacterium]